MKTLWQFFWNLLMVISGCGLIAVNFTVWAGFAAFFIFGGIFLAIGYQTVSLTHGAKNTEQPIQSDKS
jgi:hypothetical protein